MQLNQVWITGLLLSLVGFASTAPGLAQNRDSEFQTDLQEAVCTQNWRWAQRLIDYALTEPQTPTQKASLLRYRQQLMQLIQVGAKIPGWEQQCRAEANLASSPRSVAGLVPRR